MRRLGWVLLVMLLSCSLLSSPVQAESSKRAVLLLIDGLRLDVISQETTPHLWQMQQSGASGVINQIERNPKNAINSLLTINTGARAIVSQPVYAAAYGTGERVKTDGAASTTGRDLYLRHTGREPQGTVVFPALPHIAAQLDQARFHADAGALGDAVHRAGGRTAALGNSDLGDEIHRPAALLAMDGDGAVDIGNLQAGTHPSAMHPYGLHTDVDQLYRSYQQIRSQASLIVIDSGDLARLHRTYGRMTDSKRQQAELAALQQADRLVGKLLPEIGPDHLMLVVSPDKHPDPAAPPLTPVLLAGGSYSGGGLLSSPTTKRTGLVAQYDLAPTLAQFFSGEAAASRFQGQAMQAISASDPHQFLTALVDRLIVPSQSRHMLVRYWLDIWIGLAAVLLAASLWRRAEWFRTAGPFLEVMMIFPLAWLLVPLLGPRSVTATTGYSLTGTLAIFLLLRLVRDPLQRLGWLAGVTAFTLMIDLLLGAPLLKQSLFSYDPIAGARYYGIGNEYMGVLLGAVLLALNAWQGRISARWQRAVALFLFAAVIWLFAAPTLGTNAGGAMAAAVGCAYWLLHSACSRVPSVRQCLILGGGMLTVLLLVLAGMLVWNGAVPSGQQTHIGRVAEQLVHGEFTAVGQVILRKVELNLHLLRVSAWGKLFLLFAALTLLVLWRPQRLPGESGTFVTENTKRLWAAALAAFLFNDSGVVAAALILLYAAVPLALFAGQASGHTTHEHAPSRLGR
ncbi:hypothetical protein OS242_07195 [Tumebacillus sp. DT12]|uniref:Metalloenzyme domain-containing protein n=1 Tax=Tumebacillus lacus TaxID=2995335 RepID=A0ABT3WYM9_9BACL|nr:hypothetical protein [Tumebacillus lacus]MCX7569746.1 hypothetical protein [Tumebacillus lacus]